MKKQFRIGLTGNMGTGKTMVANVFAHNGIQVIDTDEVARALSHRMDIKKKLVDFFSTSILLPNQVLNRRKLLELIMDDHEKKKWLEDYLHPLILKHVDQLLENVNSPYVVIAMPLLLECGYKAYVDRICLVIANESVKIQRICARDGATPGFAKQVLSKQMPTEQSMGLADDIITNNDGLADLTETVDRLHRLYAGLAAERVAGQS